MTGRLVRLLRAHERDAEAVCLRAKVSLEEVTSEHARIPYGVADALVEQCVVELGAAGFACALADVFDENTYDVAGLVLMSSPTLGDGLTRAFAYQRLWGDGERFTFQRDRQGGVVAFRHPGRSAVARALLAELAFVEILNAARLLVDPDARAVSVRFAHAPVAPNDAELVRRLGVEPSYHAKRNELVLDERLLSAPIHVPEGALSYLHETLARRAVASLPDSASLRERVRSLVSDNPHTLAFGIEDVALRLRLPARTLQRKLACEGTSFSDLVDGLRRARVRELDLSHVAEKQIAFLVGFADPSALTRARARWARSRVR
jgi:AraC-like DNA-binding protein